MTNLTIKTTYSEKLIEKYMIDHYFMKLKKVRWAVNIICAFIAISYICFYNTFTTWLNNVELLITIILCIVLIEFNTKILPRNSFKKIKHTDKTLLNSDNTYHFLDKEINIENNNGSSTIKYSNIYTCIEVKNAYYIYINDRQAIIIDKDKMDTTTNNTLSKILREKIANYQIIKR